MATAASDAPAESPLKTYLDSLASPSVNCATVSQQARNQLSSVIGRLSIDQLAHEQEKVQSTLKQARLAFAKEELSEANQPKYAHLCTAHKDIFSGQQGKLAQLRELNERTHRAMEDLQVTLGGKNVDLSQISADFRKQQNQKAYLEQMLDVVNVPWTINQCLHANRLPQACQLIISFEYAFPAKEAVAEPYPMLLQLITKEISILKKKVISMLYVYTEESYQGGVDRSKSGQVAQAATFYSTKVSLQLLQVLGEPQNRAHSNLLRMRAKHVRERVQKEVLRTCTSEAEAISGLLGLLRPYLDTVTRIYTEFEEIGISGRQDWLYERYSELRKLAKVLLSQVLKGTISTRTPTTAQLNWFDTILTLNNLVTNFNLAIGCSAKEQSQQEAELIPLCISDLLAKLLFAKLDQTVDRYESKLSRTLSESDSAFVDVLEAEIADTKTQIEQIGLPQETIDEYISKSLSALSKKLPKTLFRYLELAQIEEGSDSFSVETFLDSLVGLMRTHGAVATEADEEAVKVLFDSFLTIFF